MVELDIDGLKVRDNLQYKYLFRQLSSQRRSDSCPCARETMNKGVNGVHEIRSDREELEVLGAGQGQTTVCNGK